ncbi:MAG: aldehyde dehydrogenase family protein [Candidatus Nanopelagicales bacterium]
MATIPGIDPASVTPVPFLGGWTTGTESTEVRSPYDDALLGSVPVMSPSDVDAAVAYAKTALHDDPLPQWKRAEILDRAAEALLARRDEFGQCIALEAAKPIRTARVEAERAASTMQFSAAVARTLTGETVPLEAAAAGEGKLGFVLRVPIGVVGAISPFNFPLNLVAHKLGPAIAAGCPVVLKPATQTPFSAILLARTLIEECGLPPAYLQIVTGGGTTVGGALVDNPDVALITFTGSPEVGWSIRAKAARKRVGLELGNNAPVIIDADGDWQTAVAKIKIAGFSHAGQSCISTQRIFVHESLVEPVTAALVEAVKTLVVGDPMDEATDVSALISKGERDRVKSWIDEAVAEGGRVACGGEIASDGVLQPTVIVDAKPEMNVCALEVFGPVVAIQSFTDFDDALRRANDTRYGLQAGVFTPDVAKAIKAARTLDFGGVLINEVPTWRADQMPYGGLRDSGNTREGPAYSVREMTEERLIVFNG